jgi:hypothetical protein
MFASVPLKCASDVAKFLNFSILRKFSFAVFFSIVLTRDEHKLVLNFLQHLVLDNALY